MCGYLSLGVSGLLNNRQVSPDHIWEELYTLKKQLDAIQKDNQELKKNQSELLSQIQQKQNMSTFSGTDIKKLQDRLERFENENRNMKSEMRTLNSSLQTSAF